ncbi:MAG: 2-hydroxyacyl-CoA dehydratase family protein [Planctomycetaceae bacterium]|nr:2-hydroxyacyl-CoA dehydratase family protein [Planctomycetaceae bacterium]
MESSRTILTKIFTDYYLGAAQAKKDGKPIAYVTAFTPVEILRAMDITCLYPESYAVVCSASGKAGDMIGSSGMGQFAGDLCSYSLISLGMDHAERLPYGGLPEPDFMVATNNQCGTTLLWFRLWSQRKNIPLFMIDYPTGSENTDQNEYVYRQYLALIEFVKKQTGRDLDQRVLAQQAANSRAACKLWSQVHVLNQAALQIDAAKLANALFPIVAARGTPAVCRYCETLIHEHSRENENAVIAAQPSFRLLWHGYPLWFLPKRYPSFNDDRFQIVLNDYTLWWDLDYPAADTLESLIRPYTSTYLNWLPQRRIDWTEQLVRDYAIDGVILHANRSCRRALAHVIPLRDHLLRQGIPSIILESDMANPDYYSPEKMNSQLESFKESILAA